MKKMFVWLAAKFHRIVILYVGSLLLCAALFSVIEDRNAVDSLWYVGVTSLTIGYGDIAAVTPLGRGVVMLFAHMWVLLIAPLVIVSIHRAVVEDVNEFSHAEQEEIKALLKRIVELEERNVVD